MTLKNKYMLIENLIEQLQKLPKGTNVCLYDHRKNMGDDSGDGSSAGIYPEFEISLMDLEPDEIEFLKEQHDRDFVPWVAIAFDNDDYDEDGRLIEGMDRTSELITELLSGTPLIKVHEIGEKETFWCETGNDGRKYFYVQGWGSALGSAKDRLFDVIENPEKWRIALQSEVSANG
jgi:hypothetical protein